METANGVKWGGDGGEGCSVARGGDEIAGGTNLFDKLMELN